MITQDILDYMATGQPFSCSVVSFDRKRKRGGAIREFTEAVLVQKPNNAASRPLTGVEAQREELHQRKNPHHRKWYTRNIRLLVDGHPTSKIETIHPPLIVRFNGQSVTT